MRARMPTRASACAGGERAWGDAHAQSHTRARAVKHACHVAVRRVSGFFDVLWARCSGRETCVVLAAALDPAGGARTQDHAGFAAVGGDGDLRMVIGTLLRVD